MVTPASIADGRPPSPELMSMQRSLARILIASLLASLAACGDLEVRSIAATDVVPASLQGFWSGTWQSDINQAQGLIDLRIQEYKAEPLVAVTINNPCVVPGDYELVLTQGQISLQIDDVPVLEATLRTDRALTGTYGCNSDRGTWQAIWIEALPEVIDLSGSWDGRLFVAGQFEQPVSITLEQRVRSGSLVLEGEATLPGALPFPVPLRGVPNFRETDFELILQSEPGSEPQIVLTGIGDRESLGVPVGLLQVLSLSPLPFSQAMVELERR